MAQRKFFNRSNDGDTNDVIVLPNINMDPELTQKPTVINANEALFLEAVKERNLKQVQRFIREKAVDINCSDSTGETALQIAVHNDMPEMVDLLMRSGAEMGNALFQAISRDSDECFEILIDYYEKKPKAPRLAHTQRTQSQKEEEYGFSMTPIVLAAQKGNYKFVKELLHRGHRISKPHLKSCEIANCQHMECMNKEWRLENALMRLNTYKALASPVYLCLSYLIPPKGAPGSLVVEEHDPIYRAIILKKELEEVGQDDYEYKAEYMQLSNECEEFAVRLLSKCRSLEESASVMDVPDIIDISGVAVISRERQSLNVINFAIKNRNKKFVAHPISQLMLNAVLYNGIQGWEKNSLLVNAPLVFVYTLLLPLFSIVYLLTPKNFLTAKMEAPLIKFMSHAASFCWFLVLIIMSAFQDKFSSFLKVSPLDVVIALWVFGILVEEVKQGYRQGVERYFTQWWHLVTIVMVLCYIIAGVLWITGFALSAGPSEDWVLAAKKKIALGQGSDASLRLVLLSNTFFALGLLFTFFQASHTFQANSHLGPLQLSMMNMVSDCFKFLILFSLNFFAFALAMRKLYTQFIETRQFQQELLGKNYTSTAHVFEGETSSFRLMFWGLFDKTDLESFKTDEKFAITAVTGELLFAGYNIAAVIVALNMLIAMLSNTFQKIADDQDVTFKFIRSRIWMQYVNEGSVMAPPFNLVPTKELGSLVYRAIKFCCSRHGRCEENCNLCFGGHITLAGKRKIALNATKRKEVFKNLIRRHFFEVNESNRAETIAEESEAKLEKKLESLTETVVELQEAIALLRQGTYLAQAGKDREKKEEKNPQTETEGIKNNQMNREGVAYGWKF